jgi:hypothetical protein
LKALSSVIQKPLGVWTIQAVKKNNERRKEEGYKLVSTDCIGGYKTMERLILNLKDEDWDGCGFKDDTNTLPLLQLHPK